MKKILVAMLIACMVLSVASVALAATPDLTISNLAELKAFRDQVNAGDPFSGKTILLDADIDLGNEEWTPIGNSTNNFSGHFDGGNHTISNLKISTPSKSDVGFFGFTTNGSVKDLTIKNASVQGRLDVGVVAGTPYTSKYNNITVTGKVTVDGMAYVGGVFGKNLYANVDNITVDVTSDSYVRANSNEGGINYRTYVGGVVGFMGEGSHTVSNVKSNIDVIGTVCDIGGITGIAHYCNKFVNVSCSGNVTVDPAEGTDIADFSEAGGIAGTWHNEKVTTPGYFENCSFTGKLTQPEGTIQYNDGLFGVRYDQSISIADGPVVLYNGEQIDDNYSVVVEITFVAGEGTDTMYKDSAASNSEYTLPENGFTAPAGKKFKAWSIGGEEYAAGDKVTIVEATTITAIWEADPAQAPAATPVPAAPAAPAAPAPKTGDNTNLVLWMALMAVSAVALVGLRKKAKASK